ncbi:MAG: preprotein translocase subunit YajC [Acidobacteriia bacterium]|nr:preprotein translocase subunit YajC [Terriglobia bacterium]
MIINPLVLAADAGAGWGLAQLLPFVLIFGIFYFLLILPQQRQRRKVQEMLANLKTGDRVVTSGGIYGTVVGFRDSSVVQLQVASQVKIDVARSAIAALQPGEGEAASSSGRVAAKGEATGKSKK